MLAGGVEAALGGPLLALLGDDAGGVRAVGERDGEHLLGRRHFEVERDFERGHQPVDILVGDVAPVLAQMRGDAVGAGLRGGEGGADRIGMRAAARVPDRRDMVDVDAEAEVAGSRRLPAPRLLGGHGGELGGSSARGIVGHVEADQREEGHAEIGARRPSGRPERRRRSPRRPLLRSPRIASREERPVVTTSSTSSTFWPGSRRKPRRSSKTPVGRSTNIASTPSARPISWPMIDAAHRRRDDDVDRGADALAGSRRRAPRRGARRAAGPSARARIAGSAGCAAPRRG